jgi:hypothetical protein
LIVEDAKNKKILLNVSQYQPSTDKTEVMDISDKRFDSTKSFTFKDKDYQTSANLYIRNHLT